jgi:chromosome segregation ATPase
MWSRSKKARREAALAAAVQILKCKAELDNCKALLDKLRRPKNDERRLDELDRAWHVMMDAIQAIDGKNEPLVKQLLAKMDRLDEEGRKISELQFRRYDLEREVRIAEPVRAEAFAEWKQARAISLALTSLDSPGTWP